MILKLAVGKTYITKNGRKFKIVSDEFNPVVGGNFMGIAVDNGVGYQNFHQDGKTGLGNSSEFDLAKEYKPPVIHKQDVIWVRSVSGRVEVVVRDVEENYKHSTGFWKEVHRETVEYVEEH